MTAAPLLAEGVVRSVVAGGSRFTLTVERFSVDAGEKVAVVGPSGCGKSTLLALLSLAMRPDASTTLQLDGADAWALWQAGAGDALAAIRSRSVGFVPQTGALLPFLSLRKNILLTQWIAGQPDPAWVAALTTRLGIADVLDRLPAAVSVGQRQRAAIARALAHRPRLVFADEPTASVHPAQADEVLALLTEAARDNGAALVITTHDPGRAAAAGFALAPCLIATCEADTAATATRFCWP